MSRRAIGLALVAFAAAFGGCGGDPEASGQADRDRQRPDRDAPTLLQTPPARGAQAQEGRRVVAQAGCLACHLVGAGGNDGPGDPLTGVGADLSPRAIRRALLDPPPPMPSYEGLPRRDREALVAYLSQLRDR